MTQDEIIETAREAGGQVTTWVNHSTIQKTTTFTFESPLDYYVSGEYPEKYHIKFLEAFAKLVAAKEREACAKVCEELPAPNIYSDTDKAMWDVTCIDCATAILERGQA
jgi:hypothetical protein